MSLRLKRGEPVGREVKRVLDRQLARAMASLQSDSVPPNSNAVHEARKHVKKARAVLRLARTALDGDFEPTSRSLRTANRVLGPMADARAVVETIEQLRDDDRQWLPTRTIDVLRAHLLARAARIQRRAEFDRARDRLARLLSAERRSIETWALKARGRSAVIPEISRTHRAARDAMHDALARPTGDRYHVWRKRVKAEWYLVRLVADHCGGWLLDDERRLGALDRCLGELHNLSLLQDLITQDSPLSRRDTAHALQVVRAYRRDLRHQARLFGAIYRERPGQFAGRVSNLWGSPAAPAKIERRVRPWPRVA